MRTPRPAALRALRRIDAGMGERIQGAIALLAIDPARDGNWMLVVCYLVLYTAAVLTLWSMVVYLKAAWLVIKDRDNPF